jgi:hypothetical protein
MKTVHYINLTNGIEALRRHKDAIDSFRFMRLQSTACEQKRWSFILDTLPDDLYMNLVLGNRCIVYDYSPLTSNRPPRALWQGLEFVRYVVTKEWFGCNLSSPFSDTRKMISYFKEQYNKLPRPTLRRIKYYKKFKLDHVDKINLLYVWGKTAHDGDYSWYKNLIENIFSEEIH